jgi:hypothetical protein
MNRLLRCPCGQRLQVGPELAGKKVRCPACAAVIQAPTALSKDVSSPAEHALPFPVLGIAIAVMAIVVGGAMVVGGIGVTVATSKPGGFIVFSVPGLLWVAAGALLLLLKAKFAYPFSAFLVANILLGALFTTAGRSWGGSNDGRIFAIVGLGFLGGALLFQLFHAFLIRDLQRQKREAKMR